MVDNDVLPHHYKNTKWGNICWNNAVQTFCVWKSMLSLWCVIKQYVLYLVYVACCLSPVPADIYTFKWEAVNCCLRYMSRLHYLFKTISYITAVHIETVSHCNTHSTQPWSLKSDVKLTCSLKCLHVCTFLLLLCLYVTYSPYTSCST